LDLSALHSRQHHLEGLVLINVLKTFVAHPFWILLEYGYLQRLLFYMYTIIRSVPQPDIFLLVICRKADIFNKDYISLTDIIHSFNESWIILMAYTIPDNSVQCVLSYTIIFTLWFVLNYHKKWLIKHMPVSSGVFVEESLIFRTRVIFIISIFRAKWPIYSTGVVCRESGNCSVCLSNVGKSADHNMSSSKNENRDLKKALKIWHHLGIHSASVK
jgi:hypothetical protein